jgi:[ribosomal protein S5]-alanine N-acetyltransferase
VLGRFNLFDVEDDTAVLGYRVAEHVAGRGVATATVLELCRLAASEYGLRRLSAAVNHDNIASQKVLAKAGFLAAGPANPGGHPGTWYRRDLDV